MKLIVACDPDGGIGYNNRLPWDKIQGDLPRFKLLTSGKSVLMGYNTWTSLPKKPLPNRTNYVLSSRLIEDAITVQDIVSVPHDVWLMGGARAIDTCWDYIDEIHLTRTFTKYTCDTFINLVRLEKDFECVSKETNIDHYYEIWKK